MTEESSPQAQSGHSSGEPSLEEEVSIGTAPSGGSSTAPPFWEDLALQTIHFFGGRSSGKVAALLRVALGLLEFRWALQLLPNAERYFSEDGVLPYRFAQGFPESPWTLIAYGPTSLDYVQGLLLCCIAASVLIVAGVASRPLLLLAFLINVAFGHRNPYITNGGDALLCVLALLGVFLPLDHRYSLSAWLKRRQGAPADPGEVSVVAQRLIGLQLCYVYLYAFMAKAKQGVWLRGEAMSEVLDSPMLARFPMNLDSRPISWALSWGTLLFELLFPYLIWQAKARRPLLLIGIIFHLGIEVFLKIPLFTSVMLAGYLAFLSDEDLNALSRKLRGNRFFARTRSSRQDSQGPSK